MKIDSDRETAKAIFSVADARLQAAGERSLCSQGVFGVLASAAPDAVSYALFDGLSNEDFLQAVYLVLLHRPIDDAAAAAWASRLQQPQLTFRTALLNTVLASGEYRSHFIPLKDCPLPLAVHAPQLTVYVAGQGLPQRLVRVYQRLPRSLQRVAKKIVGKE